MRTQRLSARLSATISSFIRAKMTTLGMSVGQHACFYLAGTSWRFSSGEGFGHQDEFDSKIEENWRTGNLTGL